MNSFQLCRNTSDTVPLYLPQNLYLKPIARINISVQFPQIIEPGKSISNWEIMEKIRAMIKPEEFSSFKISKSSLEVIRFEAEIEDKSRIHHLIALLDGRSMKLNTFAQSFKIRAAEAKQDFPTKHTWDTFFRDAKNMNEMRTGERPDTVHISNLPIKWFVAPQNSNEEDAKPSQKIFHRIFEKFGHIRVVDIPICDPYRKKMKEHMSGMRTFTFDEDTFFEGYVQFKDYVGFVRAMDAFRGMKLLYKDPKCVNGMYPTINIKVDFDRTKHLSDASIKRRQIVRDRFMEKEREAEEKELDFKKKLEQEEMAKRLFHIILLIDNTEYVMVFLIVCKMY